MLKKRGPTTRRLTMLAPLSNSFFSEVKLAVKSNLDRCQHLLNVSWKVSKLDTKVRVLGSLGFRKLVFKIYYYIPRVRLGLTQRLWWWWEWLRSCPSKRGSFWPVLHFILFFQKGIDEGPPHLRIMAFCRFFPQNSSSSRSLWQLTLILCVARKQLFLSI